MKRFTKSMLLTAGMLFSLSAIAAAPLAGTQWKTIDDKSKQPKSVVEFYDAGNGTVSGKIIKILDSRSNSKEVCDVCKGQFKDKKLTGATIVTGLKPAQGGEYDYEGGKIIDPESGKTYSVAVKNNGSTLTLRGYIGIKAAGRTQTWQKN